MSATANKSTSIDSCVRGWTSAPEWRRYLLGIHRNRVLKCDIVDKTDIMYDRVLYPRIVIKLMSSMKRIASSLDPLHSSLAILFPRPIQLVCDDTRAGWIFHDWICLFDFYHLHHPLHHWSGSRWRHQREEFWNGDIAQTEEQHPAPNCLNKLKSGFSQYFISLLHI